MYFEEANYFPTLNQKINFETFCDNFAKFAECTLSTALKFTFKCFDLSSDGLICEHDTFSLIDILKEDSPADDLAELIKKEGNISDTIVVNERKDNLFLVAFLNDINLVSKLIQRKRENQD